MNHDPRVLKPLLWCWLCLLALLAVALPALAAPTVVTVTTLQSSANPVLAGSTTTLSATVTGSNPGGTVTF